MPRPAIFEWHAKEYSGDEKSAEWYWALGVVTIGLFVASILFKNILLGLVILAGAASVSVQAVRKPRIHRFAITEGGIIIDSRMYPFDRMMHFSVLEYTDETIPPALSIKTRHILSPHLMIPIIGYDPVDIYDYIAMHLPEGNHHESVVDHLIERIKL
jgi:hypothetical protein